MCEPRPNGYRVEQFPTGGGFAQISYIGTLEDNRAARIWDAKKWCEDAILKHYPEYKQINAALGIYPTNTTQEIINGIQVYRAYCNTKEAELNAATTFEEIWAVDINFNQL